MNSARTRYLYDGLLFVAAITLYTPSLSCGFVGDDLIYFIGNTFIKSFDLETIIRNGAIGFDYVPFRDLSFAIDYRLWGENPFGFHLTSVLLFGVIVVTVRYVFISLNNLIRDSTTYLNVDTSSFLAALIVAVHPNHREVVYAVFNRGALLTVLFSLFSIITFVRFLSTEKNERYFFYIVSVAFYSFAVMSREYSLTLPLAITLLVVFDKHSSHKTMNVLGLAPFYSVAVIFFNIFRDYAIGGQYISQDYSLFSDFASKASLALKIIFFYLVRMVTSLGQFDFDGSVGLTLLSGLVIAGLLHVGFWKRDRYPQLLFGLLFYLVCLPPVLNFYKTLPIVSPRYSFLSCLGLFFIITSVPFVGRTRLVPILLVVATFTWTMMTMYKTDYWKDNIAFWEFWATRDKSIFIATQLGYAYYNDRQYSKASEILRSAQPETMDPKYFEVLGNSCFEIRDYPCAIQSYENLMMFDGSGTLASSRLEKTYLKIADQPNAIKYIEKTKKKSSRTKENYLDSNPH